MLRTKDPKLAREPQTQVPEPGEAETRMSRGEAAPAVVEPVLVRLRAHADTDPGIRGCSGPGLAPRDQIRARAPHGVLHHVRQEGCERQRYREAEDRDVGFVPARASDEGPEEQEDEGRDAGEEDVVKFGHALVESVRVGFAEVGEEEETVEGGEEETD